MKSIFTCTVYNFNEIKDLNDNYIDLSHAINSLNENSTITINFPQHYEIDSSCKFIVKSELKKIACKYLNFMFSSIKPLNLMNENEILDK